MSDAESEYPSWRTALFGNGHAANIRCAIKYGFWQLGYVLLALVGGAILAVLYPFVKLAGSDAMSRVVAATDNRRLRRAFVWLGRGFVALLALAVAALVIRAIIRHPFEALVTVAGTVAIVVGILVVFLLIEVLADALAPTRRRVEKRAAKAGERAQQTPVARRLYGYCPVSTDIEPKWFERLTERFE